jgi:DNA replication protein DnaC
MMTLRNSLHRIVENASEVRERETDEQIEKRIAAYYAAQGIKCLRCLNTGHVSEERYEELNDAGFPHRNIKTGEPQPMRYTFAVECPECHGVRETTEEAYWRRVRQAGVPEPMWGWTLKTFPLDRQPKMVSTHRQLTAWAEHPHGGIVLIGDVGRGKTSLAAGATLQCIANGLRVKWWQTWKLQEHLRAGVKADDYQERLDRDVHEPTILVLDDYGTEQGKDFPQVIEQIVTRRYAEERAFIVTMNLTSEQMGDRLASRFQDGSRVSVLDCVGIDLRKGKT